MENKLKTKKISDFKVPVLKLQQANGEQVKGKELFANPYSNIFILAKKKSGKTNLINAIIRKTINKNTAVHFFVSTIEKDDTYAEIIKYLKSKGIKYDTQTAIEESESAPPVTLASGKTSTRQRSIKVNRLKEIVDKLLVDEKKSGGSLEAVGPMIADIPPEPPKPSIPVPMMGPRFNSILLKRTPATLTVTPTGGKAEVEQEKVEAEPKKKGRGKVVPEHLFIFDDLSASLRNSALTALLKKNRHIKSRVIISSQWLNDMEPSAIQQLDYMIAFGGIPAEKVEEMRQKLDLDIGPEKFFDMYRKATAEKYHFLYIDVRDGKYRQDFDKEIEI